MHLTTGELVAWVVQLRIGRPEAAEPTLLKIVGRVGELARAMFRQYPRVGRFVDADDVIQGCLVRLLAALREVRPTSTRHFYALVNELIRRELLDLAKHYYGPRGHGTNLATVPVGSGPGEVAPAAPTPDPRELERMAAFHQAVERLPAELREGIGLTYYHGLTQAETAGVLGVSVRTVQRWADAAAAALRAECHAA